MLFNKHPIHCSIKQPININNNSPIGLPVSKCHLISQSEEAQWMLDEILLLNLKPIDRIRTNIRIR